MHRCFRVCSKIARGAASVFAGAILIAGTASAATDELLTRMDGDVIGQLHFAGTAAIGNARNMGKLKALGALPETEQLRQSVVEKLSTTPFRLFQHKLAQGNTNDYSQWLRPLIEDVLREESYAEMRGPSDAAPEFMIAVHVDSAHAKVWHDNLSTVIGTWTGIPAKPISGDGFTGWEIKKHLEPNVIRCLHVGDWVLFGWGQNDLKLQAKFVQRIKQSKRPVEAFKENWLEAVMDWPSFMRYHPFNLPEIFPATLPKMHLTVETRSDYVRPKLTMQFPQPLGLNLEPWKIPTEIIHNPISSFSVARGLAPWLGKFDAIKNAQLPAIPNQAVVWAMRKNPFETFAAAPMPNASNYLAQVGPQFAASVTQSLSQRPIVSEAAYTNHAIVMTGIPFLGPFMASTHERDGDYLTAGLFPPRRMTNSEPLPPDLMRVVKSNPNLVYYGWEINQQRLVEWVSLSEVYQLMSKMALPTADLPAVKWLRAAQTHLGNCATEVTLTAPNELTLVRNAPVGLTSVEMVSLEYWLDAPGFPLEVTHPRTGKNGGMVMPAPGGK